LLALGVGSIAGARLFQRTLGFNVGGNAIFRTGGSETRGGVAAARRSAGFGGGGGATFRSGACLATTGGGGSGFGFGLGRATIVAFLGRVSTGSGSEFFVLREAETVFEK